MLEHLTSFEQKQIDLSSLVGSLEFLFNALETVDIETANSFASVFRFTFDMVHCFL